MVEIIERNNNFFLQGLNHGLLLEINCCEQITDYNILNGYLEIDSELYQRFSNLHENTLAVHLNYLMQKYKIHRHQRFDVNQLAASLMINLNCIRALPEAGINSMEIIYNAFNYLKDNYLIPGIDLPQVTLSKILHFISPNTFGIVDSIVLSRLKIWGYRASYDGLCRFLKDLFQDNNFDNFQNYVLNPGHIQIVERNICMPNYFLKVIDKVLWTNSRDNLLGL
jgi:hypothetical protein